MTSAPINGSDAQTTVAQLRCVMDEFVQQRDWHQFHSPKNLSMALTVEAGELMEHFQWLTVEQSRQLTEPQRHAAGEELADVLCYALSLANALDIDLATAIREKMEKNRRKYPAEEYQGRFGPEDPGPDGRSGVNPQGD